MHLYVLQNIIHFQSAHPLVDFSISIIQHACQRNTAATKRIM